MANIHAYGSFVPFNLFLEDNGYVGVLKDLLGLRFNLQVGTMYVKQEMYFANGEVSRTILMQKNRSEGGFMWILGPGSFRVMGLFDY